MNSNIIFRTSNELERVHLLVIELEHTIFGFEQSNIKLKDLLNYSSNWLEHLFSNI